MFLPKQFSAARLWSWTTIEKRKKACKQLLFGSYRHYVEHLSYNIPGPINSHLVSVFSAPKRLIIFLMKNRNQKEKKPPGHACHIGLRNCRKAKQFSLLSRAGWEMAFLFTEATFSTPLTASGSSRWTNALLRFDFLEFSFFFFFGLSFITVNRVNSACSGLPRSWIQALNFV